MREINLQSSNKGFGQTRVERLHRSGRLTTHGALSVEVGRVVYSLEYGKGFIAEIEENYVRVRFWKHGYKKFYRTEHSFPFDLLDELRPIKQRSIIEKVLARDTALEREERELRCEHLRERSLCPQCAGLTDAEIGHWRQYQTNERPIRRDGKKYVDVRIASRDCSLVSRSAGLENDESDVLKYESEVPASKERHMVKRLSVPNFSQMESPANEVKRHPCTEIGMIARDLFTEPNSRFGRGGTGYLRVPLNAPRNSRADAPEWLDRRGEFLMTLKPSRAARAEEILTQFYAEGNTDTEIAGNVGWGKDSVKRERATLVKLGDKFFWSYPPSPAIYEREADIALAATPQSASPASAICEGPAYRLPLTHAPSLIPTNSVAVYSPTTDLIRVVPIFRFAGNRVVKTAHFYVLVSHPNGFLREEPCIPKERIALIEERIANMSSEAEEEEFDDVAL